MRNLYLSSRLLRAADRQFSEWKMLEQIARVFSNSKPKIVEPGGIQTWRRSEDQVRHTHRKERSRRGRRLPCVEEYCVFVCRCTDRALWRWHQGLESTARRDVAMMFGWISVTAWRIASCLPSVLPSATITLNVSTIAKRFPSLSLSLFLIHTHSGFQALTISKTLWTSSCCNDFIKSTKSWITMLLEPLPISQYSKLSEWHMVIDKFSSLKLRSRRRNANVFRSEQTLKSFLPSKYRLWCFFSANFVCGIFFSAISKKICKQYVWWGDSCIARHCGVSIYYWWCTSCQFLLLLNFCCWMALIWP